MKTREITRIAIFAALTACLAQVILPLPFTPIFITMGILAIHLTGAILPPKQAFLAQLVYLLLGVVGMPVFGGFKGGIGVLFGPTGGYLWVYPIMAWITSYIVTKAETKGAAHQKLFMILGMTISVMLCYTVGTLWLAHLNGIPLQKAIMAAVVPFLLPDCGKIILAALISPPLRAYVIGKTATPVIANDEISQP